ENDADLQSVVAAAVARYQPGLLNFFLRRCNGNEAVAAELTQETCAELWRAVRAGKYDPDRAAISTFLYAIANHRWLQHRRVIARRTEFTQEPDASAPDEAPTPEDWLNVRELLDHFRACLRGDDRLHALSEREQEIVRLFSAGETERAIAKTLKFAPSTVHAVKKSAFQKLQNCLREKGYSQEEVERTLERCE
ncbi:MAG: RNA polymerase sigma factor, partial [Phycisphaerae bacterium]